MLPEPYFLSPLPHCNSSLPLSRPISSYYPTLFHPVAPPYFFPLPRPISFHYPAYFSFPLPRHAFRQSQHPSLSRPLPLPLPPLSLLTNRSYPSNPNSLPSALCLNPYPNPRGLPSSLSKSPVPTPHHMLSPVYLYLSSLFTSSPRASSLLSRPHYNMIPSYLGYL